MIAFVFPPAPEISLHFPPGRRTSLAKLCQQAGIPMRVTGLGAHREIFIADSPEPRIMRKPGTFGDVWMGLPPANDKKRAEMALCLLAYAAFDYAARECVRGHVSFSGGRGRPRRGHPMSAAERQRRSRASRS